MGGGDKPKTNFQILGYVHDFDVDVESAHVELWTLDGATMLASTDVAGAGTPFIFPESDKLKGRLLLKADVPGHGTMMNIIDTTSPNVKGVTPLSTLVLETADGDYSEDGIANAEKLVAKFVGVPESDEYSHSTLIGTIPLDPESQLRAFDPTGFSYPSFKDTLMPAGSALNFNEAIADWAESARNGDTRLPSLAAPNDDGNAIFMFVMKYIANGVASYAQKEAIGWILKLISGGGGSNEVLEAIKEMSRKLDEIQRSLYRLECDIKEILSRMAVDITQIGMKPNLDLVQTAYNIQLMEIASGDMSKERRVQLTKNFANYYETMIDQHLFGIDSGIQKTASGGKGLYMQLADNALAAIRNGKSIEEMVANYVSAYVFFVGVQIKGLLCKVEILNMVNTNDLDRKKAIEREVALYNKRIQEQSVLFLDGAELIVTANAQNSGGTFNYHMFDYMPKRQPISDNAYSIIDEVAGDSRGFEAQVVFRLLFDLNAPDKPWSRMEWKDGMGWFDDVVYIRDYSNYFSKTGVKAMMLKLVDNVAGKHLPIHLEHIATKEKINADNGEFGSVQKVSWKEPGMNPVGKEAFVMRWVFGGAKVTSKDEYRIADALRPNFRIEKETIYRNGTIDQGIIASDPDALKVKMEGDDASCSMTTFAWIPNGFLIHPTSISQIMADHEITMQTLSRRHQNLPAYIGWERIGEDRSTIYQMTCDDSNKSHHRGEDARDPKTPVFFRKDRVYKGYVYESWRGIGAQESTKLQYSSTAMDSLYFIQPPTILSIFLDAKSYSPDAKEKIIVRYNTPVFIGERFGLGTHRGGYGFWHWNYDDSARRTRVTAPPGGGTNYDAYWYLVRAN